MFPTFLQGGDLPHKEGKLESLADGCIKVAACVCAKDGVLAAAEESRMFEIVSQQFPDYSPAKFNSVLHEFFDSDSQLEDYLDQIESRDLRQFTLDLASASASADGLDIRENIALKKAYDWWGYEFHATDS